VITPVKTQAQPNCLADWDKFKRLGSFMRLEHTSTGFSFAFRSQCAVVGSRHVKSRASDFKTPSEIMNHFGSKGGPQRIHHSQNVDNFLSDGATDRT
jgi:hypothetical protein